jgi:hypothetical protein
MSSVGALIALLFGGVPSLLPDRLLDSIRTRIFGLSAVIEG